MSSSPSTNIIELENRIKALEVSLKFYFYKNCKGRIRFLKILVSLKESN